MLLEFKFTNYCSVEKSGSKVIIVVEKSTRMYYSSDVGQYQRYPPVFFWLCQRLFN